MSSPAYTHQDARNAYQAVSGLFSRSWSQEKRQSLEAVISPLVDALEAGNAGALHWFSYMDISGTAQEFVTKMASRQLGWDNIAMNSLDLIVAEWLVRKGVLYARPMAGPSGFVNYSLPRK